MKQHLLSQAFPLFKLFGSTFIWWPRLSCAWVGRSSCFLSTVAHSPGLTSSILLAEPWPRGLLVWASVYTETGALVNTVSRSAGVWWCRLIHQLRKMCRQAKSNSEERKWHGRHCLETSVMFRVTHKGKCLWKEGSLLYNMSWSFVQPSAVRVYC